MLNVNWFSVCFIVGLFPSQSNTSFLCFIPTPLSCWMFQLRCPACYQFDFAITLFFIIFCKSFNLSCSANLLFARSNSKFPFRFNFFIQVFQNIYQVSITFDWAYVHICFLFTNVIVSLLKNTWIICEFWMFPMLSSQTIHHTSGFILIIHCNQCNFLFYRLCYLINIRVKLAFEFAVRLVYANIFIG